jgi:hypothetical protein
MGFASSWDGTPQFGSGRAGEGVKIRQIFLRSPSISPKFQKYSILGECSTLNSLSLQRKPEPFLASTGDRSKVRMSARLLAGS